MRQVTEHNRFIGQMRREGKSMAEANRLYKERGVSHARNPEGIIPEAVAVGAGILGASIVAGVLLGWAQRGLVQAQYGNRDWRTLMRETGGNW